MLWECRHVSHSRWKNSLLLAKTKTTDGLLLQNCTVPIAFGQGKKENHAMASFVLIGDFFFFFFLILVLIWVTLSVSSLCCLLSLSQSL